MSKLTEPQADLLARVCDAGETGLRVRSADISLAGELSALDLLKHRWRSTGGKPGYFLFLTEAGRARLQEAKNSVTRRDGGRDDA